MPRALRLGDTDHLFGNGQDNRGAGVNHDAAESGEAHYKSVISVDARRSGQYDDIDRPRMRAQIYRVLETAFAHARVGRDALHMEDRGDGVLLAVASRIAVTRLLGLWLVEVHEKLRAENRGLRVPLGLRIGMHVGPVRHDERGISGRAVDLACRLADSSVARELLDAEGADLVLVTSQSLYEEVVSGGGKFIEPARYSSARLELKEGEVTAWFHLPGRPAPDIHAGSTAAGPFAAALAEAAQTAADFAAAMPRSTAESPSPSEAAPAPGHRSDQEGTHYTVHGDMSQHHDNVYQQSVHIGRTTDRDTGRPKGGTT